MDFQQNLNKRWRKELFRICVLFAAIGSIAEIVIYLYDSSHGTLFLPLPLYRARFIYIPSGLNLIVIVTTYICLQSKHLKNATKNTWACILIYFLCANTQVIHYVYGPLLMLPSIAIFVSILFSNKWLTLGIGLASLVSLAIAHQQASIELRNDDPQLTIDTLLAALVIIVTYIAARLLINYVSEQVNYILKSNMRQKQLIEECNMDPLMEIQNRRALNNRLDCLVNKNYANEKPFLAMIDIDDFKKVNDTYGHISGDEVLLQLGQLIKYQVSNHMMEAYRYGGEEIVLIITKTSKEQAFAKVDALRKEFEKKTYSFCSKKQITLSGGLAEFESHLSTEVWIQKADEALYIAKKSGKNKVIIKE